MKISANSLAHFGICTLLVIIPTILAFLFNQLSIGFLLGVGLSLGGGIGFELGDFKNTAKFNWMNLIFDIIGLAIGAGLGVLMIIKL